MNDLVHLRVWMALSAALLAPCGAHAESAWNIEVFAGAAAAFTTSVDIRQGGQPAIEFDAVWESRSFDQPIYYAARIARASHRGAWTLDLVHLKLHLVNRPPGVDAFAISHGYNLLTAGYLWQRLNWHVGGGAGVVIAHPENTVRGRPLPETGGLWKSGYELAGPAVATVLGWRRALGSWIALSLEGRATFAHARISIAGGHANVPSIALHGLAGISLGPRPSASASPR